MAKLRVGILGATGAVGQNYLSLLEKHPWFEVSYVAASHRSAGKSFGEVIKNRWFMDRDVPEKLINLIVGDATKPEEAIGKCDLLFSSYEGNKEEIQVAEMAYAGLGLPVVSNNSAHRWTEDVPMIIPEVNPIHIQMIDTQRKKRGFRQGFVVTKPNCSIQSYMAPLDALIKSGYAPKTMIVTTAQAVSGAGYPGVSSLDMIDNIVPYIGGEDEKTEREPLKILGDISDGKFSLYGSLKISATCTRVPIIDGHTAMVNLGFANNKPSLEEVIQIWRNYKSEPQELELPSAPNPAIIYRDEDNRPQPRKDRYAGNGMAITVGRLRNCDVLDIRFIGLSHNTIRGAAGGAILTAELLHQKGYF